MKYARQIYLTIIVLCLIIISVATYFALGGFDKPEVFVFEGASRTVIGKHFIGRFTSDEMRDMQLEIKSMINDGKLKGQLTLVEYQNDTIGQDSVHLFIGASFDEIRSILEIPVGFTYEEFKTDRIYRVFITQHALVRPYPAEIRSLMEVRAIEEGEVLQPYTFDLYYDDGSWRTEGWVR